MPIDYSAARKLLDERFSVVVNLWLKGKKPETIPSDFAEPCDKIFSSATQAYREVLLGCVLARIQDRQIDIRVPYVKLGGGSFNGRTLDERAVNPFLHDQRIPSTKGPYLSVFRRSVKFEASTGTGTKDKHGFDAFLQCVAYAQSLDDEAELIRYLDFLLYQFARLREGSQIVLARIARFNLAQYWSLIEGLTAISSGGRFPLFLAVAAFKAIHQSFNPGWDVEWQQINAADSPSGAVGDITLRGPERIVMAIEITERVIDRSRVVSTFNTKISPSGIEDYLFLVLQAPDETALEQGYRYFAQGHDVNFANLHEWIVLTLATVGKDGRRIFNAELLALLDLPDVPKALKVAWNDTVNRLASGG